MSTPWCCWPPTPASGVVPPAGVTSWNTRTGVVVPLVGDYDSDQVDNASAVPGATTSDALDALLAAIASSDAYTPADPDAWTPDPTTNSQALDQLGVRASTDLYLRAAAPSDRGNVFNTWAELWKRVLVTEGKIRIWIHDQTLTIPAGAYLFDNPSQDIELACADNLICALTFAAGAQFKNGPKTVRGLIFQSEQCILIDVLTRIYAYDCRFKRTALTAPVVEVTATAALVLNLDGEFGVIEGDDTVFELGNAGGGTLVLAGTSSGAYSVDSSTLAGAGGLGLAVFVASASSLFSDDQPGLAAPPITQFTDLANRVGYTPSTPGDWSVPPVNVADALDSLAANDTALFANVSSVQSQADATDATIAALAASDIANDSGVTGATVADALDALEAAIPAAPVASVFGRTGAVAAAASDYNASQVDNDSGVSGAFVDDALDALDADITTLIDLLPVTAFRTTGINTSGTALTTCGLGVTLGVYVYAFQIYMQCFSAANTTGLQFGFNFNGAGAINSLTFGGQGFSGTTGTIAYSSEVTALNTKMFGVAAAGPGATVRPFVFWGTVDISTAGIFDFQFCSGVNASQVDIKAGARAIFTRLT